MCLLRGTDWVFKCNSGYSQHLKIWMEEKRVWQLRHGQLTETWTTYWDMDILLKHGQLTEIWTTYWDADNLLRRGQFTETWTTYWDMDILLRHGQLTEIWITYWDADNLLRHGQFTETWTKVNCALCAGINRTAQRTPFACNNIRLFCIGNECWQSCSSWCSTDCTKAFFTVKISYSFTVHGEI